MSQPAAPSAAKPPKTPRPILWSVISMVLFLGLIVMPLAAVYGLALNYNNNPLYAIGFLTWAGAFIYIWAGLLGGSSITGSGVIWGLMAAALVFHILTLGLGFKKADKPAAVMSALAGLVYLPLGILGMVVAEAFWKRSKLPPPPPD